MLPARRRAGALPDTVALSEPIRREAFGGMDTLHDACTRIGDFAEQARARILAERRAPSVQVEGRLDDNRSASRHTDAGLRRLRGGWGEIAIDKPLSAHFTLLIKHNALFAALLPRLTQSFACLALVHNPLSVLVSWQTVDLPVHRGRIPAGEALDGELHRMLEREPDVVSRQLIVLDWFFGWFSGDGYRARPSRASSSAMRASRAAISSSMRALVTRCSAVSTSSRVCVSWSCASVSPSRVSVARRAAASSSWARRSLPLTGS